MATICTKDSCDCCPYFRFDIDSDRMSCWLRHDCINKIAFINIPDGKIKTMAMETIADYNYKKGINLKSIRWISYSNDANCFRLTFDNGSIDDVIW